MLPPCAATFRFAIGKTEPGPHIHFGRPAGDELPNFGQILRRDPQAIVCNHDFDLFLVHHAGFDGDLIPAFLLASPQKGLVGIFEDVGDRHQDLVPGDVEGDVLGDFYLQFNALDILTAGSQSPGRM